MRIWLHQRLAVQSETITDTRRSDLRRMRVVATLLLILMAVIFAVSSLGVADRPWLAYIRAFAEAGMVGGCADWFAVVALFRQPLGLPIPHTGIVPQNQARIGDSLGRFISNNFLSRAILAARLEQIDAMRWGAGWLTHQGNKKRVARQFRHLLPDIIRALPKQQLTELMAKLSLSGLEALPAAPVASKVISVLWAQNEAQALLDRAIELAEAALVKRQYVIRQKVSQHSSRFIPKWVDAKLADKVTAGLLATFAEMRSPGHPWRIEVRKAVEKFIFDLANDPELFARGEAIKAEILKNQLVRDQIQRLCEDLEAAVSSGVERNPGSVANGLEAAMGTLGRWLDEDQALQDRLNGWLRRIALHLFIPRRAMIGAYISNVVKGWDTQTLVERFELQVGKDLQYIRINGTIFGGLIGVAIYVTSKWLSLE